MVLTCNLDLTRAGICSAVEQSLKKVKKCIINSLLACIVFICVNIFVSFIKKLA
jgi:hypothetical protein